MINRVTTIQDKIQIQNCIISVADKTGCADFVLELLEIVPDLSVFSTGGTFTLIEKALPPEKKGRLINISDFTGQPEMQGGLVKTLDFKIYTGILSEPGNTEHRRHIREIGGRAFDMIVVNLYPFRQAAEKENSTVEDARSHIDIGGPSMLRGGAKNFLRVASVCDPADYGSILSEMKASDGRLSVAARLRLAKKAFAHTEEYDRAIHGYFENIDTDDLEAAYTITDGT